MTNKYDNKYDLETTATINTARKQTNAECDRKNVVMGMQSCTHANQVTELTHMYIMAKEQTALAVEYELQILNALTEARQVYEVKREYNKALDK
jgi:hypothetical protein